MQDYFRLSNLIIDCIFNFTINKFDNRNFKCNKTGNILDFGEFPNTWAVERTVKLVTEASSKIIGQERRNYYILNVFKSRAVANIVL